jgi:hypothetical protein
VVTSEARSHEPKAKAGAMKPMRPFEARMAALRAAKSPGCGSGCGHAHGPTHAHAAPEPPMTPMAPMTSAAVSATSVVPSSSGTKQEAA